jgi:hypothetical protein
MNGTEWLTKLGTARLFLVASIVVVLSLVLGFALYPLSHTSVFPSLEGSTMFRIFYACIGAIGAPAGIFVILGMLWYWGKLDSSPRLNKGLWFVLFLVTGPLGLSLYSLLVYQKRVRASS